MAAFERNEGVIGGKSSHSYVHLCTCTGYAYTIGSETDIVLINIGFMKFIYSLLILTFVFLFFLNIHNRVHDFLETKV